MKIKFPIDNDRDFQVIMTLITPDLMNIDYASPEARELYNSLTQTEREELKYYIERSRTTI